MAANLWSFIRNFSVTKFYEAAQQGSLTGAAPFTFGAIFAFEASAPSTVQTIFGNSALVNTGFSVGASIALAAWNGTKVQGTGPIVAATGGSLPPATDLTTTEAVANAFYSAEVMGSTIGTSRGSQSGKTCQLVHVALSVPASGNQAFYVNGHQIGAIAVGLATAVNPIAIGVNSGHLQPADQLWLAGCFYHNAAYTQAQMALMYAACARARDVVGPSSFSSVADPTYMWSVKRSNFDCRASWVSDGSAATPITMVRSGVWTPTGVDGDLLAADLPWMSA
jgi:hypothetical protein